MSDDKKENENENEHEFYMENEPQKLLEEHFDIILGHMHKVGASDIYLSSSEKVCMDISGNKIDVTKRMTTFKTIEGFAKKLVGDNAIARLNNAEFIDLGHEQRVDGERYRFRINLTNITIKGQSGIQITIRSITVDPPALELIGLDVNHNIYKNFFPMNGLVLVTGPTGSGKSTLMASCVATKLAEPNCNRIINTYEEPIEFVYDNVEKQNSRIYQTSVPNGVASFSEGLKSSLRRAPEVIIIGELRDAETISAAVEAGQTGHLVIGTAHTTGVPATVRRLITKFPSNERDSRQADILDQLHMIVAQKLLKTKDGKRVAVRETLVFTSEMKDSLLSENPLKINLAIRKILNDHNLGMLKDAKKYLDDGIIDELEYKFLAGDFSGEN
jgi:defect-in-organelle-trafficking protein DotB